jgi:hypothetical protein
MLETKHKIRYCQGGTEWKINLWILWGRTIHCYPASEQYCVPFCCKFSNIPANKTELTVTVLGWEGNKYNEDKFCFFTKDEGDSFVKLTEWHPPTNDYLLCKLNWISHLCPNIILKEMKIQHNCEISQAIGCIIYK